MQKPLNVEIKGLSGIKTSEIISRKPVTNQVFLEISKYVRHRQLTDALESLETIGITDDWAVLALAHLQQREGET